MGQVDTFSTIDQQRELIEERRIREVQTAALKKTARHCC